MWAYQFNPRDNWDYDSNAENVLADIPINGTVRKILLHSEVEHRIVDPLPDGCGREQPADAGHVGVTDRLAERLDVAFL